MTNVTTCHAEPRITPCTRPKPTGYPIFPVAAPSPTSMAASRPALLLLQSPVGSVISHAFQVILNLSYTILTKNIRHAFHF